MFLKTSVVKLKRGLFNICLNISSNLTKIAFRICKNLTKSESKRMDLTGALEPLELKVNKTNFTSSS